MPIVKCCIWCIGLSSQQQNLMGCLGSVLSCARVECRPALTNNEFTTPDKHISVSEDFFSSQTEPSVPICDIWPMHACCWRYQHCQRPPLVGDTSSRAVPPASLKLFMQLQVDGDNHLCIKCLPSSWPARVCGLDMEQEGVHKGHITECSL